MNRARTVALETVDFELVRLRQTALSQELADVLALIALQLKHLAVLGVFDYSTIARKFLQTNNAFINHPPATP